MDDRIDIEKHRALRREMLDKAIDQQLHMRYFGLLTDDHAAMLDELEELRAVAVAAVAACLRYGDTGGQIEPTMNGGGDG